jgi:predicted nucleic acid-binding protein
MIFVDAWAWIALADKSDPYHRKAKTLHKKLVRAKRKYVTTVYVLGEAITYLTPRSDRPVPGVLSTLF